MVEDKEMQSYIENLENQVKEGNNKVGQLQEGLQSSMFQQNQDSNLITWQLELDNILERIEHLLRGDEIGEDDDGNVVYKAASNTELIVMNDYGIKLIMNTISFYLNRNTILSNYTSDRINDILHNLGYELADLIEISYVKMGMDTVEKKARYTMLVINILHTIESAYNRSLSGGERSSLRSITSYSQTDNIGNQQQQRPTNPRLNLFKPATWS